MSRRRLNNPLDLTELEFKEISTRKLRKFKELAQKHNHIVVIGRNGAGKSTVLQDFKGIKDFAPNIKLYIAINSFEALEAFRYFYDDCVIYNAETSKVIKYLESYEAYKKEILSPIMKAFGKDLAFFKDFIKG